MEQYISKAAVVAEIEKRKNENLECETKACQGYFSARTMDLHYSIESEVFDSKEEMFEDFKKYMEE